MDKFLGRQGLIEEELAPSSEPESWLGREEGFAAVPRCESEHLPVEQRIYGFEPVDDSNLLVYKHSQAGVKCHDCHESSIVLQAEEGFKYVTGDYKDPLEKRNFANEGNYIDSRIMEIIIAVK